MIQKRILGVRQLQQCLQSFFVNGSPGPGPELGRSAKEGYVLRDYSSIYASPCCDIVKKTHGTLAYRIAALIQIGSNELARLSCISNACWKCICYITANNQESWLAPDRYDERTWLGIWQM